MKFRRAGCGSVHPSRRRFHCFFVPLTPVVPVSPLGIRSQFRDVNRMEKHMIIGNFLLKSQNSFNGEIHTLTLHLPSVRIQFIPLSGKKPDYSLRSFPRTSLLRSLSQSDEYTEIGAGWKRSGSHGDFISVKLDCPALAQPIQAVLRP